jgi:Putative heavy-metal-binding
VSYRGLPMSSTGSEGADRLADGGDREAISDGESLARIEDGGIPLSAERRLKALAGEGQAFTSGLSVSEFALLNKIGPRPLAQVQGTSVFKVGWQYLPAIESEAGLPSWSGLGSAGPYGWDQTVLCELDTITRAWDQARRRALDRITEEAVQLGADAVVGVKLARAEHDWAGQTIDYMVTGTAIRWKEAGDTRWPLLSDVSVQDYWRLLESGHEPVGLLATTTVIFVSPSRAASLRRLATTMQAQELEELSRAFSTARETIRAHLHGQVDAHKGTGAVGVTISHRVAEQELSVERSAQRPARPGWAGSGLGLPSYSGGGKGDIERKGWVITMHGSGTAIRARPGPPPFPAEPVMGSGSGSGRS